MWHEGRRESPFVLPAAYTPAMTNAHGDGIGLVGFDGDDTLWRSEDYYRAAQAEFEAILAGYVDFDDLHDRLFTIERRNLALFGYGAKGMTLSMVEAAIAITDARISAADLHAIVELGKTILRHPVDLLPGIREAVADISRDYQVVLIPYHVTWAHEADATLGEGHAGRMRMAATPSDLPGAVRALGQPT